MNSKLDVRFEAAKMAVTIKGIKPENVVNVARDIESYILSGVDLPETYDNNALLKESMALLTRNWGENERRDKERHDKIDENFREIFN